MTSEIRLLSWAFSSLLAGAVAATQHHPDPHHRHHHRAPAPGYDLSTETTLHCRIDSVEEVLADDCRGCDGGTHLKARCASESCDIHLGPAAFLKDKSFSLAQGDEVDVTGSRVSYDGGTSVIAKEVKKGDAVLTLRDEQGKPLWRAQPR